MLSFTIQLSNKKSREKLETDCYVTSRKWEEEVEEKGEVIAKEDRVKEIYRQRKKIVGSVFGQVKFNLGLVDFA